MNPLNAAEPPTWTWPEEVATSGTAYPRYRGGRDASTSSSSQPAAAPVPERETDAHDEHAPEPDSEETLRFKRRFKPRTCRICLDVVNPTFETAEGAAAFLHRGAKVRYVSEDAEYGRLISPCKCKGSQKYVHEGCLQAWRNSQPLSDRNFWKCPTCAFEYKLERLNWSRWLTNRSTRVVLTLVLFVATVFILGFISDPIMNMWFDPVGTIADSVTGGSFGRYDYDYDDVAIDEVLHDIVGGGGWWAHFTKGFFSLGVLGFLKTMVGWAPFYWLNIGGRRNRRNRTQDINIAYVIIGVVTFLGAAWKFIGYLCGRFLESASERVADVQTDGDDDEDPDGEDAPAGNAGQGDGGSTATS